MTKNKIVVLVFIVCGFSVPSYAADITAFAAPDSSFAAIKDFLSNARELKIATYTFTSSEVAELLHGNVTIIVDKSPAGGFPQESKAVLCGLAGKGVLVYLYDGPLRFMHAKYIVKDGKHALVTSENIGDDGFPASPNHGNRGWGIIVEDRRIAEQLAEVFFADLKDSKPLVCDGNYTLQKKEAGGTYNPAFNSQRFRNQSVSLIIAPDAVPPLIDLISAARSRILVEQFYVHRYFDRKSKSDNPLLEATITAARRGVNVSVLLDSFYYNVESGDPSSNLYTQEYLSNVSRAENLSLEARLIDLSSGILKLHNKGLIADDAVLISSINWNQNSPTRNREVGVVVRGEAADYFASVFDYDFNDGSVEAFATIRNALGIAFTIMAAFVIVVIRKRLA